MSRKIVEIYNELIIEKQTMSELTALEPQIDNSQTLLQDLTSTSKVAIWRLYLWLVAVGIWVHEKEFDLYKKRVEEIALNAITGNLRWYRSMAFKFQIGDILVFQNGKYDYALIKPNLQIIQRCAVYEVGGQLRMKVAKLDSSGFPEPLNSTELTAFNDYLNAVKFAGTNIAVISSPADEIILKYEIKVNQQIISLTGESVANSGTYPIVDTIKKYLQNLPFDGVLNFTKLTDAIQQVEGVIDPVFIKAHARYGTLPFTLVLNNYYIPNAGYIKEYASSPINQNIIYM